jgi:hypothetical protein
MKGIYYIEERYRRRWRRRYLDNKAYLWLSGENLYLWLANAIMIIYGILRGYEGAIGEGDE